MPVYEEPRHRQVFKSGTTRILELIVLPGDTSLFHSHEDPIAYINLSSARFGRRSWARTGRSRAARRRARRAGRRRRGPASAAPAAPAPAVRVTSTTSYAQTPADASHHQHRHRHGARAGGRQPDQGHRRHDAKDAGFEGMPELTNNWFRVYRFSLPPGQDRHAHAQDAGVPGADQRRHRGGAGGPAAGAQRAGRLGLLRRRHRARDAQHQHRHRGVRRD